MNGSSSSSSSWACLKCTFANHADLSICELCETKKPDIIEIDVDDEKHTMNVVFPSSSSSVVAQKSCSSIVTNHLSLTDSLGDYEDNHEFTTGLIPMMVRVFEVESRRVMITNVPMVHATQVGNDPFPYAMYGKKWSCGYRNIQMLWSSMLAIPEFRQVLVAAQSKLQATATRVHEYWIPSINEIQALIELAWQAGFDEEGMLHFEAKLVNKKDYIGATECATLFRFLGFRAIVVDFDKVEDGFVIEDERAAEKGDGMKTMLKKRSAAEIVEAKKKSKEKTKMGVRLGKWLQKYYELDHNGAILPLYFQHDGHSRSIVGVEYEAENGMHQNLEISDLLVFDPASKGSTIKQGLQKQITNLIAEEKVKGGNNWKSAVYRGSHTFKKAQYQMIYIAPGMMTSEEYERSKVLVGLLDSEPLLYKL